MLTVVMLLGATGCGSSDRPEKSGFVSPSSLAGTSGSVSSVTESASTLPRTAAVVSVEVGGIASIAEARALALLATSPQVLSRVMRALNLTLSQVSLARRISATVDPGTGYIVIQATGAMAAAVANSDAANLIHIASATAPTARLTIVQPAATR